MRSFCSCGTVWCVEGEKFFPFLCLKEHSVSSVLVVKRCFLVNPGTFDASRFRLCQSYGIAALESALSEA